MAWGIIVQPKALGRLSGMDCYSAAHETPHVYRSYTLGTSFDFMNLVGPG